MGQRLDEEAWCMSYWGGRPTCDYAFSTMFTDDAAWNDAFWKNPRFNELVRAARGETDEAKRRLQYSEAQQILHDDVERSCFFQEQCVGAL